LQFAKEAGRHARWRAYAKGCLDLCERYSQNAMDVRSKFTDLAPRDVRQLEILRPTSTPSMSERYKQAIEKEKRLEVASRPAQKQQAVKVEEATKEQATKKKKPKKKKKVGPLGQSNEKALDEEDEVEEGIDWSDDEE
jgi:hypothetical protein